MRKYLFIYGVILAYFLFSSKSCESTERKDSGMEETALAITRDSIRNEFESDDLSQKSLRAFEEKAKQKLVDFADYLSIYSDKSLDKAFKDQSQQMIIDLFISESTRVKILPRGKMKEESLPVKQLFSLDFMSDYNSLEFIFDSIKISKPLYRTNDLCYTGSLNFSQQVKSFSSFDSSITVASARKVDIIATKVRKPFGSDTLQIWRVFLGKIE